MKPEELIKLVEDLTGKPIRRTPIGETIEVSEEYRLLERFLSRGNIKINWNEFNEVLLICNKDRMTKGFFDFFFRNGNDAKKGEILTLKEISDGVRNFRKYAMLVFGNFVFAYRTLSKCTLKEVKNLLGEYLDNPKVLIKAYKARPVKLEKINHIKREQTHYVGYLSATAIKTELDSANTLKDFLDKWKGKIEDIDRDLDVYIGKNKSDSDQAVSIHQIKTKYFHPQPTRSKTKFKDFIGKSLRSINKVKREYEKVRENARINTDIYLTWDYIDVYLATSMRKKYEYEAFYDFSRELFSNPQIEKLKLRYFDPTQSFENNRINKGLIEGLMLKRAKCTIYSVQESDTLGKDSELAATLAQGKPVIAYIPDIHAGKHVNFIKKQSLPFLRDKIDLLSTEFKDYKIQSKCIEWLQRSGYKNAKIQDQNCFNRYIFDTLNEISRIWLRGIWESVKPTAKEERRMKKELGDNFEIICNFIAIADESFYDMRARILKSFHPLGVQINLSNGVANGVLVVRSVNDCAKLLYAIVTGNMDFNLKFDKEMDYYYLEETISKCIYRVVTNNAKLTNSFWNFYLEKEGD